MVMATQNPVEHHGTYPLPESQLDRFLMRIRIGYPDREAEREILRNADNVQTEHARAVLSGDDLLDLQQRAGKIGVDETVVSFVLRKRTKLSTEYNDSNGCRAGGAVQAQ